MTRRRPLTPRGRVLAWLLLLAAPAAAQDRTLTKSDAAFPEAFSSIAGLRELSDGRVMISDRLGQVVLVADLATGRADTVGRTGGGPGEYQQPGDLYPWSGDSTLLVDFGNARFTPVSSDGGFGQSTPLVIRGDVMSIVIPAGTDNRGNVYYPVRNFGRLGRGGRPPEAEDSLVIARWNPRTGVVDSVARLKQPERKTQSTGGNVAMMPIPFSPEDDWAVAWDGRVALVRVGDYHVEWIDPSGARITGSAVSFRPVGITKADQKAYVERMSNRGGGMFFAVRTDGGGNTSASTAHGPPAMRPPDISSLDWPEVKPPFAGSSAEVTPEGDLWVLRHAAAEAAPRYDVFDAAGQRRHAVVLPRNTRLVGFGRGTVYLARNDDLDLVWLERYAR